MIQTRKSKQSTFEHVEERNQKLDAFFTRFGWNVILTGDENNPAIIFNGLVLSLYVKNFQIIFTDKCRGGQEVYRCRVDDAPDIDELTNWYKTAEHNKTYNIRVTGTPLYICGTGEDRRPVFGTSKIHYYLSKDYANHMIEKFGLNDYCEAV